MPELPEVETVARTLEPHVRGSVFEQIRLLRPSTLHPLSLPLQSLIGLRVKDLHRRGKLLLFDLLPDREKNYSDTVPSAMIIHLRMTGRVFTQAANADLGKHTRCVWDLRKPDSSRLQLFFDDTRTFGKILLANQEILESWNFWRDLGPEPLEVGNLEFLSRLKGRRAIKISLLDQSIIAGIGNIYADEALFKAGIDPHRPAASISEAEAGKLLSAIKDTLLLAIEKKGSSIRDYRDANGKSGSFQNSFSVYGRAGEKCHICGSELLKDRLGGRATVFCPHCQK